MNWEGAQATLPAFTLALDLGVLFYLLLRRRGNTSNAVFALLLMCMALTDLGLLMLGVSEQSDVAILWMRVAAFGGILFLCSFLLFVLRFQGVTIPGWLVAVYVIIGIAMALLTMMTDSVVAGAQIGLGGWAPDPGWMALPLSPLLSLPAFGAFLLIREHRRTVDAIRRNRVWYVLLGLLAYISSILIAMLPLFGLQSNLTRVLASLVAVLCMTYAVARVQLLDSVFFVQRGIVFLLGLLVVTGIYAAGLYLLQRLFSNRLQGILYVSLTVTLLVMLVLRPLRVSVGRWVDRLMFPARYDARVLLEQVSEATTSLLYPDILAHTVLRSVATALGTSKAMFLVQDQGSGTLRPLSALGHGEDVEEFAMRSDHPLVAQVAKAGKIIRRSDTAPTPPGQGLWPNELRALQHLGAVLYIPLVARKQLVGIIVLGAKDRGGPYSLADESVLTTVANQTAVALDNARLHQHNVEEREKTQTIVDEVQSGVIVVDRSLEVQAVNRQASSLTGVTPEQGIGRRLTEVVGPELWDESSALYHSITSGEQVSEVETRVKGPEGYHDTLVSVTPLQDGYLLSLSDVTHLKEVSRLKSQIVADVSHEFRAPLTNIRSYSELLEAGKDKGDESTRHRFLGYIIQETDRLTSLIDDLLDLSRLEAGRFETRMQPISVPIIVNEVISGLEAQIESNDVKVKVTTADDLPLMMADERLMTIIVKNLLSNAVKYSHRGGDVQVLLDKDDRSLVLEVADKGIGIPAWELPQIFDKFTRLKSARDAGISGTGLGLTLAKQAVDAHGGTIMVESQPDRGSRFTVCLPFEPATPEESA